MRELARRLAAAWRILRHGPPPPPERIRVTAEEVDGLIFQAFYAVGLPPSWPTNATSSELELLANAASMAHDIRDRRWQRVERGEWPEGLV